jgi:hypothetical protein
MRNLSLSRQITLVLLFNWCNTSSAAIDLSEPIIDDLKISKPPSTTNFVPFLPPETLSNQKSSIITSPIDPLQFDPTRFVTTAVKDSIGDNNGASAVQHSCDSPIMKVKNGPANYLKIIGSGKPYVDSTFPRTKDEMVWWPSNPRTDELSFRNF